MQSICFPWGPNMHFKNKPAISVHVLLIYVGLSLGADISVLKKLQTDVLNGYDPTLRPIRNQSLPLRVNLEFNIGSIVELEEVSEKLSVGGILYMSWIDELITWNHTVYDNIDMILLPSVEVWRPSLAVVNPFEKIEILDNERVPVRYFYNGTALYTLGHIIDSKCPVDTSYYPWDTQKCTIYFAPMGYFPTELELISSRDDVTRQYYFEHGQWTLSKTGAYSGRTTEFPIFVLEFTLKRKPTFLIVNIMLPIIFMSILNILVFLLPVECGERVSYAITVLLAIAVFLTLVGDNLPKVSNPMSVLSFYLLSVLILSVVICFCTIWNLHIYFKDDSIPVPRCLHAIAACCLCLKSKRSRRDKPQRITRPLRKPNIHVIGDYRDHEPDTRTLRVTWQEVSLACDKLCFVFFSVALLILTVIHMVSMAQGIDIISNDHRVIKDIEKSIEWS